MIASWRPGSAPLDAPVLVSTFVAGKITVVHFWAIWNKIDPVYDALLAILREEYAGRIQFRSVNTDDPDLVPFCYECEVANLPALALFVGAHRIKTLVGIRPVETLRGEFDQMLEMARSSISRADLHRRLVRAAQRRALLSMGSVAPALLLAVLLPEQWRPGWLGVIVFFVVPLLVNWIVTAFVCRRTVLCPNCQGSLWSCGTGNFKPRRMKIRSGVNACPHCGATFM